MTRINVRIKKEDSEGLELVLVLTETEKDEEKKMEKERSDTEGGSPAHVDDLPALMMMRVMDSAWLVSLLQREVTQESARQLRVSTLSRLSQQR